MSDSAGTQARVASNYWTVTPSDDPADNFQQETAGVYVGTSGDLVAVKRNGDLVTFAAVPQGTILPINCVRINSSGTSADSLVGMN